MKITPDQREAWRDNTAASPFNTWLDAQVRGADGALDLERLHAVALHWGVDRRAQYAHLNPGQQRMNIGNMLRARVPASEYEGSSIVSPPASGRALAPARTNRPAPLPPPSPRPDIIRHATVRDLLRMHGSIMDELREREVVRTSNAPGGDYAEVLFATAFGWSLESNSAAGHDATDAEGTKYQIKSRRLTPANGSRQLSALRNLPARSFDYVAAVLFTADYGIYRAAIIPHQVIEAGSRFAPHINGWFFLLRDDVWSREGVRDVTAEIAAAAELI